MMMDEIRRRPTTDQRRQRPQNVEGNVKEQSLAPQPRSTRGLWLTMCAGLTFLVLIYGLWEGLSLSHSIPAFILPSPLQVWTEFGTQLSAGALQSNTFTTLQEAFAGFAIAALIGGIGGYICAHLPLLNAFASPFIAASQAVPVVAVAPLIILTVGTGLLPKVLICAVIVFFPLLINTITALRGVDRDLHDVARVFGASRWQTIRYLELPVAAPGLLSGIKLSLTLSITGAVVGEFVASDSGLGFMINDARANYDPAGSYVALLTLAALSISLFALVSLLERIVLSWQNA